MIKKEIKISFLALFYICIILREFYALKMRERPKKETKMMEMNNYTKLSRFNII
jgi:hypothetical protein